MDDPPKEIESVIRLLTQSPPSVQRTAIERYFTKDASFTHPLCRTESFNGSRFFIQAIYRWYKIMSPKIELDVHSIAYDATNLILYVQLSQVFRIWLIPFHVSRVRLTTVLNLTQDQETEKYYLTSQNDLYQVNDFARFGWFGGAALIWLCQIIGTLMCCLGALVFAPVTWGEENGGFIDRMVNKLQTNDNSGGELKRGLIARIREGTGFVRVPALEQR